LLGEKFRRDDGQIDDSLPARLRLAGCAGTSRPLYPNKPTREVDRRTVPQRDRSLTRRSAGDGCDPILNVSRPNLMHSPAAELWH
jgi:hypothetical protein